MFLYSSKEVYTKLDVYQGVFGKYIVATYNRIATTVVDFTGRSTVVAIALLAL